MASRLIMDLHKDLQPIAAAFLRECEKQGLQVLVTCTYRSDIEQNELFAIGRTKPGRKVTNARAGQSKHNFTLDGHPASKAFDIVPLRNGKPVWGTAGNGIDLDPNDDQTDDLELWQRIGKIGTDLGLEWAGNWISFKEFPHFQLKD